jgi:hypothetical protein
VAAYPTCSGKPKNGSPCLSVVVSLKSDDELDQMYCAYHKRKAAELVLEPAPKDPDLDEGRVREGATDAISSVSGSSPPANDPAAARAR